jgi:anthranilate/para-aminobenzoate synthase component I
MPPATHPTWDATIIAPRVMLQGWPGRALLHRDGRSIKAWRDPLEALAWMPRAWRELDLPRDARWKGFLSYDLGRLFENLPQRARDVLHAPLFQFGMIDGEVPARAEMHQHEPPELYRLRSSFSRDAYLAAAERCLEYIRAGDVFQVNLAQVFTVAHDAPPWAIWSRLQSATPATYGAFLNFGEIDLISNSPELFLRVTPDRRVVTRPIKGTRPRLPGMEAELRDSAKDQAELNMIVDLERNDLGRVCEVGSVKVTQPRTIEAHPTVYHGVATVEGLLRPDVSFVDLLRATFPGGSVTGAPKIRAMEIIDELEPVRRGPYCGAIGYLTSDGTMEFSVAIRTMIVKAGLVHIPVGGGIVADSDPQAEYEETWVKARAMLEALGMGQSHDHLQSRWS